MVDASEHGGAVQILVVDDEESIRSATTKVLGRLGYDVITAESGDRALGILRTVTPEIILCDIQMPGMSGIELLEVLPEVLDSEANVAVIMVTGKADAAIAAACMQRGAVGYVPKPCTVEELEAAVVGALETRRAREQLREDTHWLSGELAKTADELQEAFGRLERVVLMTLEALVTALEAKSPYLAGHSARVAASAATVASQLDLHDDAVELIRVAGRMHDLGMIGVRDQVMDKRGALTPDEAAQIREHVAIGVRILTPLRHLGPQVIDYVRTHHECWDGSGYPNGLAGEDIPLGGRILAACEVYDALTTHRPYQAALLPEQAVERMRALTGKVIDPLVMDALAIAVERKQALVFLDDEDAD